MDDDCDDDDDDNIGKPFLIKPTMPILLKRTRDSAFIRGLLIMSLYLNIPIR